MALDLGLTTRQLLSAPDDVALDIRARSQRLDAVTDRAFKVSSDEAAFRTAAVGRRPYTSPPAPAPRACWAVARRRTCPKTGPRCHLINQGGCVITYGRDFGSQLFSEPALAVADADLYLRKPDDPSADLYLRKPDDPWWSWSLPTRSSSPAHCWARCAPCGRWSAWPTPWNNCLMINRHWPCWTAPSPAGTCNAATILATSPTYSSQNACSPP